MTLVSTGEGDNQGGRCSNQRRCPGLWRRPHRPAAGDGGLSRGRTRVPASLAKLCLAWSQERGGQTGACVSRLSRATAGGQHRIKDRLPPKDESLVPGEGLHLSRNPNVITHFLDSTPQSAITQVQGQACLSRAQPRPGPWETLKGACPETASQINQLTVLFVTDSRERDTSICCSTYAFIG